MRKRLRSHEGANAVEFALVLPMLLMLIFGGITAGLTLNTKQQLDHAAREGARFGATLAYEDNTCGKGADDWHPCVRDRVIATAVGQVDTSGDGGVCVSYIDEADDATSRYYGAAAQNDLGNTDEDVPCISEDPSLDTTGARVHVRVTRPGRVDAVFVGTGLFDVVARSISRHEDN